MDNGHTSHNKQRGIVGTWPCKQIMTGIYVINGNVHDCTLVQKKQAYCHFIQKRFRKVLKSNILCILGVEVLTIK